MWLIFIGVTGWVASQKNRSTVEGVMLGLFLGIFGLIIELCLPTKPANVL